MKSFKRPRHPGEALTFAQWDFEMVMMEVSFHLKMGKEVNLPKREIKANIIPLIAKARYLYVTQILFDANLLPYKWIDEQL